MIQPKERAKFVMLTIKRILNNLPLPLQRRVIHLILNYLYKEKPAALIFCAYSISIMQLIDS